jgi:hypothetical protein
MRERERKKKRERESVREIRWNVADASYKQV